jgi:hypothetical protein
MAMGRKFMTSVESRLLRAMAIRVYNRSAA